MKLKFQADLSYQRQAIDAVANIFLGQANRQSNFTGSNGAEAGMIQTELGIGNRLDLTSEELLENVQEVQIQNGLPRSELLERMNFTVEMETGTGKTYVYLRTIYELNRQYGFTKFVIVVPSVAIREGANKSLQMTEQHFKELYDCQPLEYFIYDSAKLEQVRNFAMATAIQVMIINIDAFRKSFTTPEKEDKTNVIHRANDLLNGYRPIEFIQQTNPIVIIDEPQSVDRTPKSKEAIASLAPLCTLRYSATPIDQYNLIYRLDAVKAYNKKLVKKIEVMSVRSEQSFNMPYIKLLEVSEQRAKIELDVETQGYVKRVAKMVKNDENLFDLSGGRELYRAYRVEQIDWTPGNESIEINGHYLAVGYSLGELNDDTLKRYQIRKTIEEHLEKELRYRHLGIKVLSLFFIDKVANYRDYDKGGNPVKGKYAIMFEEEYKQLAGKPKYRPLFAGIDVEFEIENFHNGYFAQDKKGVLKDTKGNVTADTDVYRLIMKEKERLLSLDEPLRFIFSHSALREGWDNPNVFQICTLKDSGGTYVSRRQEIGRGLRLAVNQDGERVTDYDVNTLTVMANESYEEFVANLQTELEEETGIVFGKIEKHNFARLAYLDEVTQEPVAMGYDYSANLYGVLKAEGYVDQKDKSTAKLKEALEDDEVVLPDEFQPWRAAVLKELKQITNGLPVTDASRKKRVRQDKAVADSQVFMEVWDKIKEKTVFSIEIDSGELIRKSIEAIRIMNRIDKTRIISRKDTISGFDRMTGVSGAVLKEQVDQTVDAAHVLPDVITELQNRTNLTRRTIVQILTGCGRLEEFKHNPQKFIQEVVKIIQQEMKLLLGNGIKDHKPR
ncbi:type III restriction endonuclease subunit R [Neobacillus notoginsengisoli]|uniref:Type III restriction endonuclease subunit R n=1 Tax=Neobacillus notoginsengisoli TaxID=1578198 RepID=A0A417YQ42_9BACI|nr:DEAD/DEAH box helicase family protein [Neobacillus notoginsengisoli]RHW35740.1 type III restriction endonuclease subunit R [Neobacillus notoginsengisoli]